jgi:hypothetical protein
MYGLLATGRLPNMFAKCEFHACLRSKELSRCLGRRSLLVDMRRSGGANKDGQDKCVPCRTCETQMSAWFCIVSDITFNVPAPHLDPLICPTFDPKSYSVHWLLILKDS